MKFNKTNVRKIIGIICILISVAVSLYGYINDRKTQSKAAQAVAGFDYVNGDYVEFIDVGQGDCTLISSKGKHCLIDAGVDGSYDDIRDELRNKGIKTIDLIIVSHYHADHTGALQEIVANFNVDNIVFPQELPDTKVSNSILYAKKECLAEDGEIYFAISGQRIELGNFTLTILYQSTELKEENNRSVYVMSKIADKKFLFTGDGEKEEEREIIDNGFILSCDVLKAAHHGGSTSSTDLFLDECNPKYAVISCAKNNMYGHPHKETMKRMKSHKIKTLITKNKGNITFIVKDGDLFLSTEK